MPNSAFPNSARAKWLANRAAQAHRTTPTPEDQANKAVSKALVGYLRGGTPHQLSLVASNLLGAPWWLPSMCLKATTPALRRGVIQHLEALLRSASRDQLVQVALVLGKSPRWVELVVIESHIPGAVGQACLKAIR